MTFIFYETANPETLPAAPLAIETLPLINLKN